MDARNSIEQYMKIKMSTYGLNQKNQRKGKVFKAGALEEVPSHVTG